jgi:cytosine/uracil/thiamine/allantoin permease
LLLFGLCIVIFVVIALAFWLLTNPHIFSQTAPYKTEDKKVPGKLSGWMFVAIALSCGVGTWALLYWLEGRDEDE